MASSSTSSKPATATLSAAPTTENAAPAPLPNPLATNPLATVELRWQRALKSLNVTSEPPKGNLKDVSEVNSAWKMATRHMRLRHLDDDSDRDRISRQTLVGVYATLKNAKLIHALLFWFVGTMYDHKQMVIDDITPLLVDWEEDGRSGQGAIEILNRITRWKTEWYRETGAFTHHGVDAYWPFKRNFRTILMGYLPQSFNDLLRVTVHSTFKTHCEDEAFLLKLADDLDNLGLLSDFKTHVGVALEEEILQRIMETCPRVRDRAMLPELKKWFNETVKAWLNAIYGKDRPETAWRRFEQYMMKTLCELRISELFEIIVDYEDKTHPFPVLLDIKECIMRTGQRMDLVQGLREQTIKRLLQPGAATSDILQQYVSTIKVLRYLDPPGVLLYGVAEPIRQYLKDRPDTIKIIVTNLIPRRKRKPVEGEDMDEDEDEEDKDGFLLDDQNEPTAIQASDEAYEDYSDPNWIPAAYDAEPTFRVQKPSDIISTLVSIFGSKDVFIKELQIAFGQRLLAISDGNYDDELHNLEILKIRFGEAALQVCDVMMKDLADSRRIDQHVHDTLEAPIHTTVLSRLFWPPMPRSTLQLPGQFASMVEKYQVEFEKQKPDKKLRYLPHLGTIDLTIEMDSGESISATVNPLQAAVIELFSQTRRWEVDELAQKLGNLDTTSVSLALMHWHMAGVIEPVERNVFELRETLGEANPGAPLGDEYELELGMEEEDSVDKEANAEMFWNFVRAMLKNLHPMTTEEIHSRFKAMAPFEQSLDESRTLLESWSRQGLVDYMGSLWSLV